LLINQTYKLNHLLTLSNGYIEGNFDCFITNICFDTRHFIGDNQHLFIAIETNKRDGHDFIEKAYQKGIRLFLIHKQLKSYHSDASYLIVQNSLGALQSWAKFHRNKFDIPVLAIAGSYGKTIVKEWIYHFLRAEYNIIRSPKSYNSKLGVALSLLTINDSHDLAIIETSVSEQGEMKLIKEMVKPTHSIVSSYKMNFTKKFQNQTAFQEEMNILSKDIKSFSSSTDRKNKLAVNHPVISSTYKNEHQIIILNIKTQAVEFTIPFKNKIALDNFTSCVNFLSNWGIPIDRIQSLSKTLPNVALRLETTKGINNSIIINDNYNADLSSIKIALEAVKAENKTNQTIVILSDVSKDTISSNKIYNQIGTLINEFKIDEFYGIGSEIMKHQNYFNDKAIFLPNSNKLLKHLKKKEFSNKTFLIKGAKKFKFDEVVNYLSEKTHETTLTINLNNLYKNYNYYRKKVPKKAKILIMIKAAGYGTGLIKIAKKLSNINVDFLGVAYTDEGIQIRKKKIDTPILVMNVEKNSINDLIDHQLTPSIYNFSQLDDFTRVLITKNISSYPVHIKLNTGMNRLGFNESELDDLMNYISSQPEIRITGIFSHLFNSDDEKNNEVTLMQIKNFTNYSSFIEKRLGYSTLKHILNSSGIERYNEASFDMVRLGLGIYGISTNYSLNNVASLETTISHTRDISKNENIGYGINPAKKAINIAIIPIGYADGFSRVLGNGKGKVIINGKIAPTIGNICMDMTMIDISNISAKAGDKVEIFGENGKIQDLAKEMNSIPYEVLSSISERVVRIYTED
jgi:Alr-MurF fusion protein